MGLDKVGLSGHLSLCGLCTWPLQSGVCFRGANEDVVLFLKKKKKKKTCLYFWLYELDPRCCLGFSLIATNAGSS